MVIKYDSFWPGWAVCMQTALTAHTACALMPLYMYSWITTFCLSLCDRQHIAITVNGFLILFLVFLYFQLLWVFFVLSWTYGFLIEDQIISSKVVYLLTPYWVFPHSWIMYLKVVRQKTGRGKYIIKSKLKYNLWLHYYSLIWRLSRPGLSVTVQRYVSAYNLHSPYCCVTC